MSRPFHGVCVQFYDCAAHSSCRLLSSRLKRMLSCVTVSDNAQFVTLPVHPYRTFVVAVAGCQAGEVCDEVSVLHVLVSLLG